MKIVQVCPYAWNARGGVQAHVFNVSRELRARGHDVLVVAPWDSKLRPLEPEAGLHIAGECLRVRFNGSVAPICLQPNAWLNAVAAIRRFAPDVVHVHEPIQPSLAMPVTWFATAPIVATFHAYYPPSVQSMLYSLAGLALRPVTNRVGQRLAVSEAAASTAAARVSGPVHVVPNGVDIDRFAGAAPMSLPPGPTLLFVGRLDPRKGIDVALRAFAALADRIEGLRFVIAGDGPCRNAVDDIPERIRSRVIMLGDVAADDLPSVYAAADVFVAPARGHESFGIVLLEAMAAGLPIVATDITGYRQVVRQGREGLLVAPDSVEDMVRALALVLQSRRIAGELADAGRARAAEFRWDAIAVQIEEYYERAIERPAAEAVGPRRREWWRRILRPDL
jgi:phosphatidylinositol alpha-mannosyltransferase